MQPIFSPPAGTPTDADLVKDSSDRAFMTDVVEASRTVPVVVDFWAPWCGPCKQLGPVLEKTVKAARGKVRLVKINIDDNPQIAGQLRVQSIPAVFAFFQGRPIDGFMGAQPESQIKQWIERLAKAAGEGGDDGIEEALAAAKEALEAGDPDTAGAIYSQIVQADPTSGAAYAGLARVFMAKGEADQAQALLDQLPPELAADKDVAAVRTALELHRQTADLGPVGELNERLARDPDDHQARYDLAMAQYAAGQHEEAVKGLLEIVRRDREWNEQAARKQLVKFFEAFGPTDRLTVLARRKLSSILFS
ncbi:thioredoxin [Arenibaculum sp.]|jgi:putative thioredoxin|uniref:thioredoxin n=1 Tax=Arenibaculum sp. TaxID=2865862 RepID=UPI002E0D4D2F|nr:thioredoxin [Arenibaculum sp.]